MRLDRYLAQLHPEISRAVVKELILTGKVSVGGKFVKPSYHVKEADELKIDIPDQLPTSIKPQDIPLKIIHEDQDLIVIDKPAGLVVHPAPGHPDGTLVNALAFHLGDNFTTLGDRARPGLVHRLDKDTSGLLVIAKTEESRQALIRLFKGRRVHKEYLALISGHLEEAAGEINKPIDRDPKNRLKFTTSNFGKESVTRFLTEQVLPKHTLLRLLPVTGRTHQLRVHLASLGHPIVGDVLYEGEESSRLFLHATKLSFRLSKQERVFESPLPSDLTEILDRLAK